MFSCDFLSSVFPSPTATFELFDLFTPLELPALSFEPSLGAFEFSLELVELESEDSENEREVFKGSCVVKASFS